MRDLLTKYALSYQAMRYAEMWLKYKEKPRENVLGLVNWNGGLVFDEVQSDLEAQGYEVQPYILPACAVNAPHRRDRVWFVAYRDNTRDTALRCGTDENWQTKSSQWEQPQSQFSRPRNERNATNSDSLRYRGRNNEPFSNKSEEREMDSNEKGNGGRIWGEIERRSRITPQSESTRKQGQRQCEQRKIQSNRRDCRYISTDWQKFPTQPPVCGGDDGLPRELDRITFPKWRNESIKAYGNAIVPQVAYQIFKTINQYNEINKNP